MRLLYITVSMPYGFGEAFFIPEVKEILRQGHQVLIVPRSPAGDVTNRDADGLQDISVRRPLLSVEIVAAAMLEFFSHPLASLRVLGSLFRSRNVPTLLKNFLVFPKALWLSRLVRRWNADHIHAQWALTTGTMAMIASEITGIPWSCTAHRGDIVDDNLLAVKTEHAAFFRFISRSGVDLAQARGVNGQNPNIYIIHMGVVLPPAGQVPPPGNNAARLICPANLQSVKGHRYLLEAMRLLKQRGVPCRLDVAGAGPLLHELQTAAKTLVIDDCTRFVGNIPHDQLLQLYSDGEVGAVVLPSVDLGGGLHEGIPVALIEAMSSGVPVISTTTGGIPELLCDGAGIMVPPKDPPALADAIERLFGDPALRQRLIVAGRRRTEEEHSVEAVISQLIRHITAHASRAGAQQSE